MENNIVLTLNDTGYFEVFIKTDSNGDFITPDAIPTYKIYSPLNVQLATGTASLVSKGVYSATWGVTSTYDPSNAYYIKWFIEVNGVSHEVTETFSIVPYKNYSGYASTQSTIIVPESYMRQIKSCLGYPLQDNIILDDNQIKDLCIERALKRYFIKFPLEEIADFISSGSITEVDFPDDDTFGVLDVGVVNRGYAGDISTSGFWSVYAFNNLYSPKKAWNVGKYGTNYAFSMNGMGDYENNLQVLGSQFNKATINYNVNSATRKVTVFSEIMGTCQIKWAKKSNNFAHVIYEQLENVILLSQAYLLEHLADTSGITDNPDDEKFNPDALKTKADERFEKVKTLWNGIPDVIVIK